MARQPQTKEHIAARVAKAQATKAAKKTNALAENAFGKFARSALIHGISEVDILW